MKKLLILAGIFALSLSSQAFANEGCPIKKPCPKAGFEKMHQPPKFDAEKMKEHKAQFEKKLNLTEEQKKKTEQLRQKGQDDMKPIMEKIKTEHEKLKALDNERLTRSEREEKARPIREEIGKLNKQAHEIRMKNMKEFESILTEKQQKALKELKEEGRKEFAKNHKKDFKRPPIVIDDPKPRPVEK